MRKGPIYNKYYATSHAQVCSSVAIVRLMVHACAQAHSTDQYCHEAAMKAMVLGLCGDLRFMWRMLDCSLLSLSADVLERITLSLIAGVLDRSIYALKHTSRDRIFLLVLSTL
jgi:hypothetical protein